MYTKICSNCLLSEHTPGIHFNENGVCNYCVSHEKMTVQGEEKLTEILNQFPVKQGKFDCMVGLSGGRDSTYTLWKLVNDYKMRVLAINYENPFTSEQAKRNMQRALEIVGVNIIKWSFPDGVHINATKKALKVWTNHPSSIMIPVVCAHCKNWWPTIFRHAREQAISLIVIGSNPLETASFKQQGFGGARTYHRFSNLPRIIKQSLKELSANPRYITDSPSALSRWVQRSCRMNSTFYDRFIESHFGSSLWDITKLRFA